MNKLILTALAGTVVMLGGCSKPAEAPAGEATADAMASDTGSAPAADGSSAAASAAAPASGSTDEPNGGGVRP